MRAKPLIMIVGITLIIFLSLGAIGTIMIPNSPQPTQVSSSSESSSFVSRSTPSTTTSNSPTSVATFTKIVSVTTTSTSSVSTNQVTSIRSTSSTTIQSTSGQSTVITLQDLISGKFPSAKDKQGTGGVTITVQNLQVLYVRTESDGDWHVTVTDGRVPVFITEITPSFQSSLGRPMVGSTIDETGVAYCDTIHQTESWHGNTCWEIHPIMSWHISTRSITVTTTQAFAAGLNATISYARNPISRGSIQNITIHVIDSDGPVSNTNISIHVDYASGQTTKDFTCTTSTNGSCSVSWRIGGNSTPGTFRVMATVEGMIFYSSFEVTTA